MMKKLISKQNRVLLSELVRTDFKLRYQGSILGYAWSLLRPLFLFVILYVVFVKFIKLGSGIPNYPVYLLLGIVLWNFFSEITGQSLSSIVGRGDLIRKIRIPRWIIVLSSSVSAVINLGLNLIVVLLFIFLSGIDLNLSVLWLPVALAEIYIFALGISLFLSAAYVRFRDVSYIWEIVMQALFYLTPILYPLQIIPNITFQKILLLNPVAQAIQDARNTVVTNDTITMPEVYGSSYIRAVPVLISLFVLIVGFYYFRRESKYFAENL